MSDAALIHEAIIAQYGSLTAPTFRFARAALDGTIYSDLFTALREKFSMHEDTDTNDDVSFAFIVSTGDGARVLRVSMVGPYAVLLRPTADGLCDVVDPSNAVSSDEARLLDLLRSFAIEPLDQATLSLHVPLMLQNTTTDECRLYQALFTDTDVLPWRS